MECLIFQYRLYAESIVTAWRSDPPLVFVVVVVVIVKTCRRKEMAPLFQCWNSRPVERQILGIVLCIPIEIKPS